jgi:hypothetical protein
MLAKLQTGPLTSPSSARHNSSSCEWPVKLPFISSRRLRRLRPAVVVVDPISCSLLARLEPLFSFLPFVPEEVA